MPRLQIAPRITHCAGKVKSKYRPREIFIFRPLRAAYRGRPGGRAARARQGTGQGICRGRPEGRAARAGQGTGKARARGDGKAPQGACARGKAYAQGPPWGAGRKGRGIGRQGIRWRPWGAAEGHCVFRRARLPTGTASPHGAAPQAIPASRPPQGNIAPFPHPLRRIESIATPRTAQGRNGLAA